MVQTHKVGGSGTHNAAEEWPRSTTPQENQERAEYVVELRPNRDGKIPEFDSVSDGPATLSAGQVRTKR